MNDTTHSGSITSYSIGFVGSIICTLAAYDVVVNDSFGILTVLAVVAGLAVIQIVVQLTLFLHLGRHSGVWNIVVFIFALIIVGIIVIGSLWIMINVNARMMPSEAQMTAYMLGQQTGL